MRESLSILEKRAVKAAISGDWELAKTLNAEIIDQDPSNLDAKNRLGKAFLELQDFFKAKKVLKQVLDADPLNQAAKRNYELAKEKKRLKHPLHQTQSLIIEPGKSIEVACKISAPRFMAEHLAPGEELEVEIDRTSISVIFDPEDKDPFQIASIDDDQVVKRVNKVKKEKGSIKANYISGNEKDIKLLITSSISVFEAERQEIKPYTKKSLSDDEPIEQVPEME